MFKIINRYPFLSHTLFWIGVFLLDTVGDDLFKEPFENCVFGISNIITQMLASYLTVYYLVPKFLLKKKYIQFIILFSISAYFISVLSRILVVHIAEPLTRTPPFHQESILEIFMDIEWLLLKYFPSNYIMVLFFGLVTYLNISRNDLSLQKEKTAAELKMLKSQLNPHFLFNTLNNIYSLSLDNSPKTSESIGRLSKILDYILYRCDNRFVLLSEEVKLLENYIALERLRYDDRLRVFIDQKIEEEIEIAPLILLSLTENAFKHGAGEDGGSPKINISIQSKRGFFKFIISNSVVETNIKKSKETIGLENIKKQLDLIYHNRYDLNINKEADSFMVTLSLEL